MKKLFPVFALGLLFTVSCRAQNQPKPEPKSSGKVSQAYRGTCGTVIVVDGNSELLLIPRKKLPKSLDKEGMEIKFDYKMLRMPNPKGCEKGNMAEISNASKK